MAGSKLSSTHAFLLGLMALMVAALCVTIQVVQENLTARVVMASIWILIALAWLVQARAIRKKDIAQRNLDPAAQARG